MFDWTDEKIQCVKDLWGKQSASEIAGIIGHLSRNAVCGKAHRLGLSNGHKAAKTRVRSPPFRKPRVQRFPEIPARIDFIAQVETLGIDSLLPDWKPAPKGCTLMELTSETCRFPIFGPNDNNFLFCGAIGADLENKRPYCSRHAKLAYTSRERRVP